MKTKAFPIDYDTWNKRKCELIAKASIVPGFLLAHRRVLASDLEIAQNIGNTSSNLLTAFSTTYCNSVVWLLFMVELFVFLFSHDEKKLAIAKRCFFGCLVVYVFFKLIGTNGGIVGTSADKIANWLGGK